MVALALFTLGLLSLKISNISATHLSPYIAVVPPTSEPIMVNWNYKVSIYTDYTGEDVWGWNVRLTFDPTVLEVVTVVNGDLITTAKDSSATFVSKVNNTIGEVSAGAFFYYVSPPPFTTSGPGIMTNITFRGISTGYSDIKLEKETKLQGYDPWLPGEYDIIHALVQPDHIGQGSIGVTWRGDIDGDGNVDCFDLRRLGKAFGSTRTPPSPNWNDRCDINRDNTVNTLDLTELKNNYGNV